LIPSEW